VADVRNQPGADNFQWFLNGTQQGSSQPGDGSSWRTYFQFGVSNNILYQLKGYSLDVFCYDHVLTGTDLANARQYLADRISGVWYAS
jgi:hypothetical protein